MKPSCRTAFTLVELLVVVTVICILLSMVMPVLAGARGSARTVVCLANLKQLGGGWTMYADEHRGYCMPQTWPGSGGSKPIFWWGTNENPPDYTQGLIHPYLEADSRLDNVFDCPEQPWGTYIPQGAGRAPTTTYGYNGLYLAPPASGWFVGDANTGWRTIEEIQSASQVFVFADTLIDFSQGRGKTILNNCYVDGPQITWGSGWHANTSPTLCFRHSGSACVFFADSHADTIPKSKGTITTPSANIGYVGRDNAPHYVPDWRKWF